MALVNTRYLLDNAKDGKYAVPALNCFNAEAVEAIVDCAVEERSGLILQFHPSYFSHASIESLSKVAMNLATTRDIPIALTIDHATTERQILLCIRNGFTGVMIDAADLPLEENIEKVRRIVEVCRPLDISVEAAVGKMPHGRPQKKEDLATEDDARRLVNAVEIDAIAPAVGNMHGSDHGEEKVAQEIDFELVKRIAQATHTALVLHGGSGIPRKDIEIAISNGVRKIVIFTDLAKAFNSALRAKILTAPEGINPIEYLEPARQALKEEARKKIRLFGSDKRF